MTAAAGVATGATADTPPWGDDRPYDVLSCDIFDTAIRRILARPEDVLLAVGARAAAAGLTTLCPDAFAVARQAAERRARAQAEARGEDEVRIAEIYEELRAVGVLDDPARGARLEFEVELAVCRPIEDVRSAVRARIARGGRVVFASDTCLPADWLAELLEACGFGSGHAVFASSDLRLGKHTGRLFPAMLAALACPPAAVLHVGDNPVSDVVRPNVHGIRGHLIPRHRPPPESEPGRHHLVRLHDSLWRGTLPHEAPPSPADPAAIGRYLAARAAPLLIGFSLFVLAEAARRGADRIWFLSRDGHLPLAVIRRLLARMGTPDRFGLHYLRASRHAVEDAATVRDYLDRVGFMAPGKRLMVDVGWHGSLQRKLTEVSGLPTEDVIGCHVGLWAQALSPDLNPRNTSGYLFAFGAPTARAAAVREGYVVLEMIFSAPHGTVVSFARGADGAPHPVLHEETGPLGARRQAMFTAMEAACLEAVDALGDILGDVWPTEIDPDSALSPIAPLLIRPSRAEVAMVNSVPFINNYAAGNLMPAFNPIPLHETVLAPRQVLRRLADSPWRAGAVRAVLPWPLPFMSFDVLQHRVQRVLRLAGWLWPIGRGRAPG